MFRNTGEIKMKMLDLFSGLGGASQAFVDAGWEVLRIENNPLLGEVPHTKLMCIFELRDWLENMIFRYPENFQDIDLIWASPPCDEFSLAYNATHANWLRENPGEPYQPDMQPLDATMDIIRMLKPRFWVVENVRGASSFFTDFIGSKPRQILGNAQFLWGNFPLICPKEYPSKAEVDERHNPLRANIRAKIPLEISEALLVAITTQKCILDY